MKSGPTLKTLLNKTWLAPCVVAKLRTMRIAITKYSILTSSDHGMVYLIIAEAMISFVDLL
jgi:hypothetical protein